MKKRPLVLKIVVIANAFLLVAAFVGCPRRELSPIINHIAPYGSMPSLLHQEESPPPPAKDQKNDQHTP